MHGTDVPINIGMERRLDYRLSFPIIDKLHKVHQKGIESLISFPE